MAVTQLGQRLGDDSSIFDSSVARSTPRSRFDLSRKHITTIDIGGIYPVDLIKVIPGDDFDISVDYLLDSFPLVVPPATNYRVRTHWYFCRYQDLWKGAETFITKGRSGNIDLKIPSIGLNYVYTPDTNNVIPDSPVPGAVVTGTVMGLPSYLSNFFIRYPLVDTHFPVCSLDSPSYDRHTSANVNALPYFMYQKIYRDNYAPINLLQDNKTWYPDDISGDDWRIDYSASNIGFSGTEFPYFVPSGHSIPASSRKGSIVPRIDDNVVNLTLLRYASFEVDAFSSARPWLQRGTSSGIDFDFSGVSLDWSNALYHGLQQGVEPNSVLVSHGNTIGISPASDFSVYTFNSSLINAFNRVRLSSSSSLNISVNDLRTAIAYQVWREVNANTNGNYNATIKAHFGVSSRHEDFEPVYIGGTSDLINFTPVVQTSADTSASKLGQTAGLGQLRGSGFVGKFHSDDYGYIMGVMIISPEVTYNNYQERIDYELDSDSEYWPEFASLGMQPILNREVFTSGDNTVDDDLFGWQQRYYYLKSRTSKVSGLMALPQSADVIASSYVQSREFATTPKLSAQFVTMSPDNVRRDFLAYPSQPAFRLQFASNISAVRCLPYQSIPNTFGF
nr:MAG: major capsid protein [Microviridae sp.]